MSFPAPFTKTLVLGLGHKARQGKDTAVKLLQQCYSGRVHRVGFADALKGVARVTHGMTAKDGPLLQRLGVAEREKDPEVWIRAAAWAIADLDADALDRQIVCVPDVRFKNEAAWVERAGGVLVRVERFGKDGRRIVDPHRDPTHISETDLDDYPWAFTVKNLDGLPEVMEAGLRAVARQWFLHGRRPGTLTPTNANTPAQAGVEVEQPVSAAA